MESSKNIENNFKAFDRILKSLQRILRNARRNVGISNHLESLSERLQEIETITKQPTENLASAREFQRSFMINRL